MKTYRNVLIAGLIIGMTCCHRQNPDQQLYPANIPVILKASVNDSLTLSVIAEKIEYIPLKTSDSILIADIFDFTTVHDNFFIRSNQSFYRFDQQGNFMNDLFKVGNGPEETNPLCFTVNEYDSAVYVLDKNHSIKVYSYSGDYLRSFKSPVGSIWLYNFSFFNNHLFVPLTQKPSTEYIYSCYDLQNDSLIILCNNTREYDKMQMNQRIALIPWDHHYQVLDSCLLYKENFCDTIFSVDTRFNQQAKYIIDLGAQKLEWETWRDNAMFHMPDAPIGGYGVQSFMETDSYLMLNVSSFRDPGYVVLFDRNNQSTSVYAYNGDKHPITQQMRRVYARNDLDGLISIPLTNPMGYFDCYEGCLYVVINAMDFAQAYQSASHKLKTSTEYLRKMYPVLSGITENSNPIMVKLYLK